MSSTFGNKDNSGVTGVAKGVTTAVGNGTGGVLHTVGDTVGAVGRGLGETVNGLTGQIAAPVGNTLAALGTGVQDGAHGLATGAKDAGEWKA